MYPCRMNDLEKRLIDLEARIAIQDEDQFSMEIVLSLLLAKLPGDEGIALLARQANELDDVSQKHWPSVEFLDRLRENLYALRSFRDENRADDQAKPPEKPRFG